MTQSSYQYFISQESKSDQYTVWTFDPESSSLLKRKSGTKSMTIPAGDHLIQVGNYVLQWSPLTKDQLYNFRLMQFNPDESNPLGSYDSKGKWSDAAVKAGTWTKGKFFGSRADFANPSGAKKGYEVGKELVLVSMHNFVLNWIPTEGRGTYELWNFDHGSSDPLPAPITPQGAWLTVEDGHELMPIGDFMIDWKASTGEYAIWQFDAQSNDPLGYTPIQRGSWKKQGINSKHQLCVIGNYILDWEPANGNFRLWEFDLTADSCLKGPVNQGTLPKGIGKDTILTGVETLIPVDAKMASKPGTMDFMRDKIQHVVYYMLENRSLDHVCGWLYDKKAPIKVIGPEGPYRGVDPGFTNKFRGKEYAITKYNNGKLSDKKPFTLDLDAVDPYHDNSDVLRQMFFNDINDYYSKKTPDMGGFAVNNGTAEVMLGYSPEQLPILNGLAKHFAISDAWHCSMPGGTDVNRAFAFTGSSLGQLNNFQNGVVYAEWSEYPHRPSIWKVLWSNGITDFKLYNAVEWMDCKFTYNLFLKGQIPSIDNPFADGTYAPQLNQFYDDLKYGTLPKFSFLEPKWVASAGSTSYHPGNDLIPGERTLNDIFNAIQASDYWDKTLFVISFDEHGGIADHVPPPYAVKPYLNESIGGFDFDILGPRIPTILISPWISENTVFRSETEHDYDLTSILATVLHWAGIPKSRWGLAQRTHHAPTFEAVIREKKARKDKIKLTPPYDSMFPPQNGQSTNGLAHGVKLPVHDLHRLLVPRMVAEMTPNLSHAERTKITKEILDNSDHLGELHARLDALHKEYKSN